MKNAKSRSLEQVVAASPGTCPHCFQRLPDPKPIVAHHGQEVMGLLRALEADEGGEFIITTIGALRVAFKPDKEAQLRPYMGQRIGTHMVDETLHIKELGEGRT